jgi:hypothetical protein
VAPAIVSFNAVFPGLPPCNAKPLYRCGGSLSFSEHSSGTTHKILVNTIPKSGTYLLAAILERFGVVNTNVHLSSEVFWDFRQADLEDIIRAPNQFRVPAPLNMTEGLVQEGQFAVGHVEHSAANEAALKKFVQLFCIRDLKAVLVSHMRYILNQHCARGENAPSWKKGSGPELFLHYLRGPGKRYAQARIFPMVGWLTSPDINFIRFESVVGDNGEAEQRQIAETIVSKLEAPRHNAVGILRECIGMQTRTYTGRRSNYADFWSDEAELEFRECELAAMNADLGYA